MVRSFLAAWWEQYEDNELGVADLYRLVAARTEGTLTSATVPSEARRHGHRLFPCSIV